MSWSWRMIRIAGIDIYVHFTFVFLLLWVGLQYYFARGELSDAITGLIFILALFCIIVMHELGHALAARRYGIRTRDITLLPIGGVARLERMPEDPRQELVVALAGPAVNVVLAAGIYVGLMLSRGLTPLDDVLHARAGMVDQLFWVNVLLVAFNLLPAFPMDGGRVLRALFAMKMDYVRATQRAALIGQAMALLFAVVGLLVNPFLILIAVFVWMGAAQEAGAAQLRSTLGDIPVMHAMITDFRTLDSNDPLSRAMEYLVAGFQHDFPVTEQGRVVGVVTRKDMAKALKEHGPDVPVGNIMHRDCVTAEPRETLQNALTRLEKHGCHTVLVVQDDRLVGLVTTDNLAEIFMIQNTLRDRSAPLLGLRQRQTASAGAPPR